MIGPNYKGSVDIIFYSWNKLKIPKSKQEINDRPTRRHHLFLGRIGTGWSTYQKGTPFYCGYMLYDIMSGFNRTMHLHRMDHPSIGWEFLSTLESLNNSNFLLFYSFNNILFELARATTLINMPFSYVGSIERAALYIYILRLYIWLMILDQRI